MLKNILFKILCTKYCISIYLFFSDDSLGYEFPFTLKAVLQGGQICAICHWTQFCRGCTLPCSSELVVDRCRNNLNGMCIAIDWDPTALHLRYQKDREKVSEFKVSPKILINLL